MLEKCGLTALNVLKSSFLVVGSDSGKLFIVESFKEFEVICSINIHSSTITGLYLKIINIINKYKIF